MQTTINKILPLLWLKVPTNLIIKSCFSNLDSSKRINSHNELNKKIIIDAIRNFVPYYSDDEAENIQKMLFNQLINQKDSDGNGNSSIFNLLIQTTNEILVEKNGEPLCRYNKLLRWNALVHALGQNIFISSYFAYKDYVNQNKRYYMAWSPIVGSDNIRVQNILSNGIAENHFHFKGSSQNFIISWISLMNDITRRYNTFSEMRKSGRLTSVDHYEKDTTYLFYYEFKQAALIMAFLYAKLNGVSFVKFLVEDINLKTDNIDQQKTKILKHLLTRESEMEMYTSTIQRFINLLKYEFGRRFDKVIDGTGNSMDYAIQKNQVERNKNSNIMIIGERKFLYDMFKAIYDGNKEIKKYQDLFYAYLAIKAQFRAELIQVNNRVGFRNFSRYQSRKSWFIKKNTIFDRAIYKMAVDTTLHNQNIKSLEARIFPGTNPSSLKESINYLESIVSRKGIEKEEFKLLKKTELLHQEKNSHNRQEKCLFYTLHFKKEPDIGTAIKSEDDSRVYATDELILSTVPRHNRTRETVKKSALAIAHLRETLNPVARHIFGIDAASHEIGCRPEVFAQAYRFLKDHTVRNNNEPISQDSIVFPKLGLTYHAGEDFLDIIDGLRAIDESINFLNLSYGSRIGHALALGIDPWEWYRRKNKILILPEHDVLDNAVWMLVKIREYNLRSYDKLCYALEILFSKLFYKIYEGNFNKELIKKEHYSFDYITFYKAWQLRGDNPLCYFKKKKFKERVGYGYWYKYDKNPFLDEETTLRNHNAAFVYYSYHFNPRVKKEGTKQYEHKITDDYIKAVVEIQAAMQLEVQEKGIAIETNPTSNVLIGTFRRYDKHPIMNFYNLGLETDSEKLKNCPQLPVSINTDDQGVFDTFLENEYSLMALALEKATDEYGNKLYKPAMIYDWLERIRQMGLEQSFKRQESD